jgi:hypothetical protein
MKTPYVLVPKESVVERGSREGEGETVDFLGEGFAYMGGVSASV